MQNFLIIIIFLLAALVLFFIATKEFFPYKKKKRFLSENQQNLFRALEKAIGENYYIFPQIHLSSLLKIKEEAERERDKYFYKLARPSVDFVLCDKQAISPILAIKIINFSEESPTKRQDNKFVEKSLLAAGLALLEIEEKKEYNADEIKKLISEKISSK